MQWESFHNIRCNIDEWSRLCWMGEQKYFKSIHQKFLAFEFQDKNHQKLQRHFPARAISISFRFFETIFVEKSHQAMSITSCGSIVVWSDVVTSFEEQDYDDIVLTTSFRKEFIKSVKICENSLSVIRSVDGYVMVSDNLGHIRFYDQELKIIFWCPTNDSIDSVVTISFDLNRKPTNKQSDEVVAPLKSENLLPIRDFLIRKKFISLLSLKLIENSFTTHRNQERYFFSRCSTNAIQSNILSIRRFHHCRRYLPES